MKFITRFVVLIMLLVNCIFVVCLLVGALSPYINPNKFLLPSFLGISFPFWVVLNFLFAVYWLIIWKKYVFLPVIALILCFQSISLYFPLHPNKKVPPKALKLLTYNTCALGLTLKNQEEGDIINYINNVDADVVCLQEYTVKMKGKYSEKNIKKRLKKYPYYKFVIKKGRYRWGIACFSKYPILNVERIPLHSNNNLSAAFTIAVSSSQKVVFVNTHLESNCINEDDKVLYNNVIKSLDKETLNKARQTLLTKLSKGYRKRAFQAQIIRAFVNKQTLPVIICGDFNDTPISYAYHTIRGDFEDAYETTGFGVGISYNQAHFFFRIDHVLFSKQIKTYNCNVDKVRYSDHYPIICWFLIK